MDTEEIFHSFHPIKSSNLVAGLLVDKRFHANTYRIEKLIHLVLSNCNGNKAPSPKAIHKWINDFSPISSSADMEDPVEDVFISKVLTEWGDFRIYEGIWEANDFHLQIILDTIQSIPERFNPIQFFKPIKALLKISEEVVKRNKSKTFQIAESNCKNLIQIPKVKTLKRLARTLSFSEENLINLGFSIEDISPFIFDLEFKEKLNDQKFGNTDLERFPILVQGKKLILILPTAISVAIRRYIFEWLFQKGLKNSFEKLLVNTYIDLIHKISILGKPIPSNLPLAPKKISETYFFEFMAEIEEGRFLQVLVKIDSLHGFFENGLDVPHPLWKEQAEEVRRRIESAKQKFNANNNFREGLSLIVVGGYGRPYPIEIPITPSNWNVEVIFAHDLETMEWTPRSSNKSLWQLLEQKERLKEYGVEFFNMSGLLNLYGWWEQTDYMLIPDDLEISKGPISLYIPTDCLAEIRQKTRQASDIHSELFIDGALKRIRRKGLSSFFKEENLKPLYASYGDIGNGRLLGCVVTKIRPWWVKLDHGKADLDPDTSYRIWDALLNWMERIASVLENTFSSQNLGPILFELDISKLPFYKYLPENPPHSSETLIDLEVIPEKIR